MKTVFSRVIVLAIACLTTTLASNTNASTLAAGDIHTCMVKNGGVQCWGANANGRLGNSSTTPSLIPVQAIPAGSLATAVAAGAKHTCAVVDGGVKCWGDNTNGKLGNNSLTQSFVPVVAIPAGSGVTAVAASFRHSCAVVAGGVKCWGGNTNGELGNNSTTQSLVPVVAIPAGSNATSVAVGNLYSCVVVDGGVQCWGIGSGGQLGNNGTAGSLVPVQTTIAALNNATVVAAALGSGHSCAVVNAGVKCWGNNGNGELGDGTTALSIFPVNAVISLSTAVAAGAAHSCAVVDGGVQCWGYNGSGQLGDNSLTQSLTPVQTMPGGSLVTAVATGSYHSCALVNGDVKCWGLNGNGQLGNNSTTDSLVPVAVYIPPTVTSTSPPATGTIGAAYTHAFTASGTPATMTWSVSAGTLPTGLALNSTTGVLSGIPTAVGVFNFTVQAANGTAPNATQVVSITVGATGAFAYITNAYSDTVSVINTATNNVIATVAVGASPENVVVNPGGTRAYVANANSSTISVIDTATFMVVATINVASPKGIDLNAAGTRLYVLSSNGTVSVFETAGNTLVGTTPTSGAATAAIAVNPAGTRAYVVNNGSASVTVVDTISNTVVALVSTGVNPNGIAINSAGTRVYVANFSSSSVSVIDTATNTVVASVGVSGPFGIALNPAGTFGYVGGFSSNNVTVFNTASNLVVATVPVGGTPFGVSVNPAGTFAYVANRGTNNVSVIDTTSNAVVATVAVGSSPRAFGRFIGGPPNTVSAAPTIGVATAGNTQATVSYTPPAFDGASPIASYTATSNPGGFTGVATTGPIVVGGLTNGTAYTFTVTATNTIGTSVPSAASNVVTPISGGPTITFAMAPASIVAGGTSVGTLTVSNSNPAPLTANAFTFNYLPGLVNAPAPNASSTCAGATPTATTGAALSATSTGFTIPASGSCTFSVTITSATPAVYSGNISAGLIVTPAGNSNATPFSLTVTPAGTPPTITSGSPPAGLTGSSYSFTPAATGTGPITWSLSAGSVPPGLTLNSSTGNLGGIPTSAGTFTFTLRATNGAGQANQATSITMTAPLAPAISLSLGSIDFGTQAVDTNSTVQPVSLTNTGTLPMLISGISSTGDFNFTSVCPLSPLTLAPGGSCVINIRFNPLTATRLTGNLTVNSNALSGGNAVLLYGTGVNVPRANINLSETVLAFGDLVVGATSTPRTLTVTNTGTAVLELRNIALSAGDFQRVPPTALNCAASLAPATSCTISIVFAPSVTGNATATLTISHNGTANGSGTTSIVNLTGNGTPRPVSVIALSAPISFADQIITTTSTAQNIRINNTGTATLTISALNLVGTHAANFGLTGQGGCSAVLPAGFCELNVTFTPSTVGAESARLRVTSNAQNAATVNSLALSGNGIPVPAPSVRLTATTIGFGNVFVGGSAPLQSVTLTNTGQVPLFITGIVMSGDSDFSQTNTCGSLPTTVAVNASCIFTLGFSPYTSGVRNGVLTITSNSPTNSDRVQLGGTGCRYLPPSARRLFVAGC